MNISSPLCRRISANLAKIMVLSFLTVASAGVPQLATSANAALASATATPATSTTGTTTTGGSTSGTSGTTSGNNGSLAGSGTNLSSVTIPFNAGTYKLTSFAKSKLNSLALKKGAHIVVWGYASATNCQDDIRISLNRALETKAALLKINPTLVIDVLGKGTAINKACAQYKNICSVATILKK